MQRLTLRARLLASLTVTSCTLGGLAHAQERPPAPATSGVGEIIVTAQKREERSVDVPIAITAASAQTLQKAGITRLEDISQIAPGVQLSRIGTYVQPAIRGVTTPLVGVGAENNVAIYVDGFYQPFQRGLNLDLANVSQVAVLKGPQGTLFGRNTTGGAIVIETLQPSLTQRSGKFSASYGSFNDIQLQGYVSTPITPTLAANLSAYYRSSDGYIRDIRGFISAPIRNHTINGKLLWQPTDRLSFTLTADNTSVSDGTSLDPTIIARSLAKALVPTTVVATGNNQSSVNHPVTDRSDQATVSLKSQYRMDWATLTSYSYYGKEWDYLNYSTDGSTAYIFDNRTKETGEAYSEEVNLTSAHSDPVSWVVGAFFFHSTATMPFNLIRSYPATTWTPGNGSIKQATAAAGYVDVTWHALDKLYLTGGVRYSDESKSQYVYSGAHVPLDNLKASWTAVTPRAVIRYELAPNTNLYLSYSKGFKSGTLNGNIPYNVVQPELLTSWEAGFKRASGRYRFDASIYHYDYSNIQVTSIVVLPAGNLASVPANAASGKIWGIEAQFTAQATSDLSLNAAVAYTHARYSSFNAATISPPNPVSGLNSTTCTNSSPPPATVPCTENETGLRMLRAPDWSVTAGADYTVHTGYGNVVLTANLSYTSRYAPTNTARALNGAPGQRYEQPDTTILNLRAAWSVPGGHWMFSAFGDNVTNTRYYITLSGNSFGDSRVEAKPANWGVRADYRF
jgi:iron complex outermembrane receptor protein